MNLWILAVAAALVVQVYALVPTCQPPDPHGYCISQGVDNCAPKDRLVTSSTDQCRTSFRFAPDHNDILIPPEWELMFDSYDYESLVGPVFLSREFDNDGDVSRDEWEDRGGPCQRGLRVCAHTLGPQDNWVFSPHIKYPPGSTTLGGGLPTEIYFKVSFRFTQCNGACVNNFADLFRYDTNSIASENVRTDKRHYIDSPFFGTGTERTTSRLDQTGSSGTVSDTRTLAIASPSSSRTNGFHFGIKDSGNCGQINRMYFYYTPCKEQQDGLVNYPELVRPPSSSLPNEGMACCAPNSHPTTSLTFRAHSATDGTTGDEGCERNVRCECDAGYRLNAAGTHRCEECPSGTYRSLTDDRGTCLDCPMNTAMDVEGAAICSCLDEFFRDEQNNEGPEIYCTTPPGPVTDLKTTANTSTSVTLEWTRPEVTGRDDFYYTYQIFDPNHILPDTPRRLSFTASSPKITYTEDRLRPVTPFTFRITTHNGVSDEDKENAALRKVELVVKTKEGVPSAPRDVRVFTEVVVWGPPQNPNGIITGYEVKFSGSLSGSVSVGKEASESYHIISDTDLSRLQGTIQVQVRAKTRAGFGDYSSPQIITTTSPPCPTELPPPPPPPPCPCTPDPPVKFLLNGKIYTDGDTVLIPDIGEGDDGLLCVTEYENCCSNSVARFYYPDGSLVSSFSRSSLYQNIGEQLVRLNKRDGSLSPTGRYRCDIPDDKGVTLSIFINIINPDLICPPPPPPPIGTCPPPIQCPTVPTSDNCQSLSSPTNGRVSASSTAFGSTATYSCNLGYSLVGASTRSCESQGSAWSGNTPSCQAAVRECPSLTSPTNGRVLVSSRSSGGIATYICNTGYTLSGSSRRTCLSNGQWSGSVAICRPESQACPVLTNPVNGNVAILGSIATYTCNPGYTRVGSNARLCQSRTWTGTAPTCVRSCPTLPHPLNGRVSVSGDRTATYTCSTGYTLSGSSTRTCQTNGAWSGTTPTCVQCPLLFQPSGGTVTISSRAPGGIAFYRCNTGNNLIGPSTRSCQTDGTWSGNAPTCQARAPQCPTLPPPLNGRVSTSGGTATYTCSTGYTLSGSSTRSCQTNGAWSGAAPTCGGVQCPELSHPSGGTVTITSRAPRGIAFYRCNTGNNLIGSSTRSCQTDGTWNGNAPTCQARAPQCPTLPPPLNGRVSASGGTATYTCSTGYTLSGSSTRTCQTDGAWSGAAPTCVRPCPTLPHPLNGRVSASGGTATYTCSTGYTLSGSSTRSCQTNGAWSGAAPTCGGVQCPELSHPSGGTVTITSRAPRGIAFYRCNTGNNLIGSSTRSCQTDGTWNGNAPTCQAPQCPTLPPPLNGRVSASGGTATYTCSTGYTLSGSSTRTCQTNGAWSGTAPTCVQCPLLPQPSGGTVTIFSRAPGRGIAFYRCNTGNNLIGSSTRSCLISGIWSGSAPTCQARAPQCPTLPPPLNGRVSASGGTATYTCSTGYTLSGSSTRTCQTNGAWSGTTPTCVQCPLLFQPSGGTVTISSRAPGGIAIYRCNTGNNLIGSSTRSCQTDGTWSGNAPTCQAPQCPTLSPPLNGRVSASGGTATYTCSTGYTLSGSSTRTCQTNGAWSGTTPTCGGVQCPELSHPSGGTVTITSRAPRGIAFYRCNTGNNLVGSVTRSCQTDGTWNGNAPTCQARAPQCPTLPPPLNGRVSASRGTATYTCSTGYTLSGSSTRTCQTNGAWSGTAPTCGGVQCPELSHPSGGTVTITSRAPRGIAFYRCNTGNNLVGSVTRSCQTDGTWNGNAPTCQARAPQCPTLPPPLNGRVSASGGIATYTCSTGYTLSGSSTRTCQTNGAWSGTAPTCGGVQCPELSHPSGGTVTITSRAPRGIAFYRCNTGNNLVGSVTRSCQTDGTWNGNAPTCQARAPQCPTLPPPLNGRVSASGGTATYTCSTGYTLSGSSTRTCQTNGAWSGTAPTCGGLQCPELSHPSGGTVTIFSRALGGIAFYRCNTGNNLVGFSFLTCQTDGTWNGNAPTCQAPQCSTLPPPLNGRVSASGGTATYTCSTGYTLSGSSTRTCQTNEAWSGTAPTCQRAQILCPVLPNPTNGDVSISTRSSEGIATYACNAGYALSGLQRRICASNGVWSGSQPTCTTGFMLRGETFANTSSISLEDIGETDEALIFQTEIKDCCRVQKIGQCYYPNGVEVGTKAARNEMYRNRDSQMVRLNKVDVFTGQAAIPGLYCCTVPNNDGILHRICANITV
ncbi:sushi, von Willebrand factor type A, EGF and pentraxin domain-containing protein 1-like isoform X2 [Halichondria panicea]|uniref:sushi, von Willebrand factor type A, EGF and pentraxin domain-containing protein 1-like isoform X2 n=1 Tax=Halichondria panicea TaxID=6063 RepID=UPI00312B727F